MNRAGAVWQQDFLRIWFYLEVSVPLGLNCTHSGVCLLILNRSITSRMSIIGWPDKSSGKTLGLLWHTNVALTNGQLSNRQQCECITTCIAVACPIEMIQCGTRTLDDKWTSPICLLIYLISLIPCQISRWQVCFISCHCTEDSLVRAAAVPIRCLIEDSLCHLFMFRGKPLSSWIAPLWTCFFLMALSLSRSSLGKVSN